MYRVKGVDGNVYGPVPAATIRDWIQQNRLDRDSLVTPDGVEAWRKLGEFPEFQVDFRPKVDFSGVPPSGATSSAADSLNELRTPGILMVLYGVVSLLTILTSVIADLFRKGNPLDQLPPETPEFFRKILEMQASIPPWAHWVQATLAVVVAGCLVQGGIQLMKGRSRAWAMTGAVLSIFPCFGGCCCLLGIPLGIWVLVLIQKPSIREVLR
jgi:hypothetical protein